MGADLLSATVDAEAHSAELAERLNRTLAPSESAVSGGSGRSATSPATGAVPVYRIVRLDRFERFGGELRWWAESTGIPTVELAVDPGSRVGAGIGMAKGCRLYGGRSDAMGRHGW